MPVPTPLTLTGAAPLTLDALRAVWTDRPAVAVTEAAWARIDAARAVVDRIAAGDAAVYGINTGFGKLAGVRIAAADLDRLQRHLILSHATGVGPALDDAVVRLVLVLKIASLCAGASGVRRTVVEALLALYLHDVLPVIPAKGSVGASGDLAPLAHLTCALLGIGEVRHRGRTVPAAEGLVAAGLQPLTLKAKEGLALINGTQVSTALALAGLFRIETLLRAAVVTGALAVEAVKGSHRPFDARIQTLRGHVAQADVAAAFRALLAGSAIHDSHQGPHCDRVQDPYSLRCQPQVLGAALGQIRQAAAVLTVEASGVTDNPLVLVNPAHPMGGEIVSGGNFHAEPVAMAADQLAVAAAEIGALAERRIAMLIDPAVSGLPPFLVAEPGLNSGFMIAHVTAAALASENKSLAHPASVDSLPTSANQEDHVSMATFAARRLGDIADNVAGILAVEVLAGCQALEFHRPLRSSEALEAVHSAVRARVPAWTEDRYFAPDIADARTLLPDVAATATLSITPTHP